jgi:DNA-binding NarL/FixJ family response regulator
MNWRLHVAPGHQAEIASILARSRQRVRDRLTAFLEFGPVPFRTLDRRETVILQLIAEGYSNPQIEKRLELGGVRLERYLSRLYAIVSSERYAPAA